MRAPDLRTLLVMLVATGAGLCAALMVRSCSSRQPVHVLLLDSPPATPVSAEAQIAGAVVRPGVYPIAAGERLDGLIAAAGGLSANADSGRINLAQRVYDGQRIDVPALNAGADDRGTATDAARVRINHASREELLTLPGVTVSQAAAIQNSVRAHGSILSSDELVSRRLASPVQAQQLASLVDWAP